MNPFLTKKLSRRNLVKSAGIGFLGASLGLTTQKANAQEMSSALPSAFLNFQVGDSSVMVMQEAAFNLPVTAFGGGAAEGEVEDLLASYNLPTTGINASVNLIVLKTGTDTILLDTGTGQTTTTGLKAVGISPEDVTRVVISHWHGDHVGGISNEGVLNFPNAMHHFPEIDWDFLQGADNDNARGALAKVQAAEDAGQLELYSAGELLTGLEAIAAPGHTPGHHTFLISSAADSLMYTADTANNHVTALVKPEWAFGFDADGVQATETRRAILGRLADDGTRMLAYHFPFPGAGFISRANEGFLFTPGS